MAWSWLSGDSDLARKFFSPSAESVIESDQRIHEALRDGDVGSVVGTDFMSQLPYVLDQPGLRLNAIERSPSNWGRCEGPHR